MPEETLLKSDAVEITTKVARFGDVAYQVANIGSVGIYTSRKLNSYSVAMFIITALLAVLAFDLNGKHSDQSGLVLIAALAFGAGGVVIQIIWPRLVSTLILKTSSNDIYKIETTDGAHVNAIRGAVEEAFARRGG